MKPASKLIVLCFLTLLCDFSVAQVTFVIDNLPKATPERDSIFMTGSFNGWVSNDARYLLKRQPDGRLSVTLPQGEGKIEYKFTRGDWQKVETDKHNIYTENRVYEFGTSHEVRIKIDNWQDLGGAKSMHYPVFFFFLVGFYGIAMLVLTRVKRKSPQKIRALIWANTPLIVVLCGTVVYHESNLIWRSYLSMFAWSIYFLWGPLFYLLTGAFIKQKNTINKFHFLPFVIVVVFSVARFSDLANLGFLMTEVSPYVDIATIGIVGAGLFFNLTYHVSIFRKLRTFSTLDEHNHSEIIFIKTIAVLSFAALVSMLVNLLLICIGINNLLLSSFEPSLFVLSMIILSEAYLLWKYPEILRDNQDRVSPIGNVADVKQRIEQLMNEEKIFRNPELTIADLSTRLGIKPHVLSKLLNRYYQKNYRDFINGYRVEEFIRMVKSKQYHHYTFLAVAHEVGFNSKSTFNLAFKKAVGQSPSEYFQLTVES